MPDEGSVSVALLGFPSAGKSTFLAAFFIACEDEADDLALTRWGEGNREYLNTLADELARCRTLTRTSQREPGQLDLQVRLVRDEPSERIRVPDLSGEHLRESMKSRQLAPDLDQLLESTDRILLFLRADRIRPVISLADFAAAVRAAGEDLTGEAAADEDEVDWSIELSPTQARILDVVQELILLKAEALRLGFVVSAWDARPDPQLSPVEWAERHLPIVLQAVRAASIDWSIFGVSAQGGNFDDETERVRLGDTPLSERAKVYEQDGDEAGIGAPLRWALRP